MLVAVVWAWLAGTGYRPEAEVRQAPLKHLKSAARHGAHVDACACVARAPIDVLSNTVKKSEEASTHKRNVRQ